MLGFGVLSLGPGVHVVQGAVWAPTRAGRSASACRPSTSRPRSSRSGSSPIRAAAGDDGLIGGEFRAEEPGVRRFIRNASHGRESEIDGGRRVTALLCSMAQGLSPAETPVRTTNFETLTDRTTVVKALNDALAYCDTAYGATTDTNFNDAVTTPALGSLKPTRTTRGLLLMFNTAHDNEHYGNIVVYMRANGKVPPSTARPDQ